MEHRILVDVSESQNASVVLWYKQGSTPDLYEITIGQTGGVGTNP